MKKLKRIVCFLLLIVLVLSINNVKIFAGEVEYTDNVIPVMTSNTAPSGKAFGDESYIDKNGITYEAFYAFNHESTSTYAWSSNAVPKGCLGYTFAEPKCITKYTLQGRNYSGFITEMPKDWKFEALDESTNTWITLDSQTNITSWVIGTKKEFTFTNSKAYKSYRINVSTNVKGSACVVIGEMEMMETKTPTSPPTIEGNKAILEVVMTNGMIKEYDLTAEELDKFLTWYDDRSNGIGRSYYKIPKRSNVKPFISRNEYLSYDKIYSFEVKDYNE
jgi:hypothetical protein